MSLDLTWEAIVEAADKLNVEPCVIKAIAEVECSGAPFITDGRPQILFEPYVFYKELRKGGYDVATLYQAHPNILAKSFSENRTRKLYKNGAKAYLQLDEAMELDKERALKSASWGAFQIMGFNHTLCGFDSVFDFVAAHEESVEKQLEAFLTFIVNSGILKYMRSKDWAGFAKRYNGPGYAANKYDTKMKSLYDACVRG